MSDTPAIRLKRGEGRAFKAGGPWIYDNEIAEILGEPADGGIVRIEDYNGYPLGVGFLNRASTIAVRLLSRDAGAVIDRDFLERRVRAAWQYRKDTVDTSSCRVIFGEADFLPGLVVDKFADVLVVESLALGIDRLKSTILSLLVDLLKEDGIFVRGIYERSDAKVRLKEGMERVKGFLSAPFDPVVEIVENGVRYQVDVAEGQKTGFFLDQKYNRLAIQPLARGGRGAGLLHPHRGLRPQRRQGRRGGGAGGGRLGAGGGPGRAERRPQRHVRPGALCLPRRVRAAAGAGAEGREI